MTWHMSLVTPAATQTPALNRNPNYPLSAVHSGFPTGQPFAVPDGQHSVSKSPSSPGAVKAEAGPAIPLPSPLSPKGRVSLPPVSMWEPKSALVMDML